jgi:hypothetical protein
MSIARCKKEKENLDVGFCFLHISIIILYHHLSIRS